MRLECPIAGVYHLVFPNQKKLCSAMMRFQEYYESPEFMGKIFTRDEFMKWYGKPYVWNGGNFPDYVLNPFKDGLFDPLTRDESKIVDIAKRVTEKRSYFILTHSGMIKAFDHEMAHALYYLDHDYKEQVNKVLDMWGGHSYLIIRELLDKGYCEAVLNDEIQAYAVSGSERLKSVIAAAIKHKIQSVYKKHIRG